MDDYMSDADALDALALFMARPGQWNGGDVCEVAADLIKRTGRPSPSGPLAGDAFDDSGEDDDAPAAYKDALRARREPAPASPKYDVRHYDAGAMG